MYIILVVKFLENYDFYRLIIVNDGCLLVVCFVICGYFLIKFIKKFEGKLENFGFKVWLLFIFFILNMKIRWEVVVKI